MLFGKKEKKKRLPDLPSSGARSGLEIHAPAPEEEDHSLPAFPDSPAHNDFSQAAIKDAVGDDEPEGSQEEYHESGYHPVQPESPVGSEERVGGPGKKNIKIVEMEEWQPSVQIREEESRLPEEHHSYGIPQPPKSTPPPVNVRPEAPAEPIQRLSSKVPDVFVKIDKFHSAKRALSEVKDKLGEIDELIKKIRETKMREDQEIVAWEKDMDHIKARMKDVTESIFEKVD